MSRDANSRTNPKVQARRRKIVAMSAAGKTDKEVGDAVGVTTNTVSVVMRKHLPRDEELQKIYDAARAKWQPEVESILDQALGEMRDRLVNGQDRFAGLTEGGVPVMVKEKVPFRDLAKGFEALRPTAMGDGGSGSVAEVSAALDPRDPAVMRALAVGLGLVPALPSGEPDGK